MARKGHSSRNLMDCSFLTSTLNFDSLEIILGDLQADSPDTGEKIIVCGCTLSGERVRIEKGSCKELRVFDDLLNVPCGEGEIGVERDYLYPPSNGESSVDFINPEGEKNVPFVLENPLRFTIFNFDGPGIIEISAERLSEENGGSLIVDSHMKEDGDVREYLINFIKSYGVTVKFLCVNF